MDLRTYFFRLGKPERDDFARRAGTTTGVVTQLAYGHKQAELGLADCLVAAAAGAFGLDGVPLTARAKRQRTIRGPGAKPRGRPLDKTSPTPTAEQDVEVLGQPYAGTPCSTLCMRGECAVQKRCMRLQREQVLHEAGEG